MQSAQSPFGAECEFGSDFRRFLEESPSPNALSLDTARALFKWLTNSDDDGDSDSVDGTESDCRSRTRSAASSMALHSQHTLYRETAYALKRGFVPALLPNKARATIVIWAQGQP